MRDKSPVRVTESSTQHLPQPISVPNSAVTHDELVAPDNDNSDNTTDANEVIPKPNIPNTTIQTDIPIALRKESRTRKVPVKFKDYVTY